MQTTNGSLKFFGEFLGQQLALVGPLIFPLILISASMLAIRGWRMSNPVTLFLATAVIAPLLFLLWRSLYGRIGDGWPLLIWPFGIACVAVYRHHLQRDKPRAVLARMAPAVATGLMLVATVWFYYIAGTANVLKRNDPIGNEAGFAAVIAQAESARKAVGASWFATTDYRVTALLRWQLRDAVPVLQVNERNRYIGFTAFADADLSQPALYIAPTGHPFRALLATTTARFTVLGTTDLVWRGVTYDTYLMQRMTGWAPKLDPPPGDPFFVGRPH